MNEFKNFLNNLAQLAEQFQKWAATIDWKAVHQRMEYLVKGLPRDLEKESISLMNRGWFIWFLDGYMNDFTEKMKYLINKNENNQDQYMNQYVSTNIDNFKLSLIDSYPNRERQIEDAFKAHELGIYYSSIPTFLAISEGIGRDLYPGIGLFAKQRTNSPKAGLPKTDDLFDSISGLEVFEESILKPLRVASEVARTINNPTTHQKTLLNRHLIMHGNSDQYGSELNSLKAISLAYFVHKSLSYLKNAANT